MSEKVNIILDGIKLAVDAGKTIHKVAEENGINIPTLCTSSKVSKTTSCLVCSVRNIKLNKNVPSCATIVSEGMEIDASSDKIKKVRQTILNLLLGEHTGDCEAPCTVACPAQAAVEEYVLEGKNSNFLESLKIIKKRIPLPMSIGRVCPRFCEKDCRRNILDNAVAINDFKRTAADLFYEEYLEELPELNGSKIAIVGGGPAGLAVAYYARLEGFTPVIFERMPKNGGMLRYGIPEYRLPKGILDKEFAHFAKMGIEVKNNVEIGKDISLDKLKEQFDAVAVTIGCWQASSMRTTGEELAEEGIVWLEGIARNNNKAENPGVTLVIGGGNTAMDCVRSAVRLGGDATCIYRRTEYEMPAEKLEIEEAKEEGVNFSFLIAPISLKKDNNKLVLTCQKMELGEPDASGRRRPMPIENSEYDIVADTVIAAIGQKMRPFEGLELAKWGTVEVSETSNMSDNVFSCGDCVTGAATVVEAVAGGRKTALAIRDFINNEIHKEPAVINVSRGHWNSLSKKDLVFLTTPVKEDRTNQQLIDIKDRCSSFDEVAKSFTKEELAVEGTRCIECSCTAKNDCKLKKYSEEYGAKPDEIQVEKIQDYYDTRHKDIIQDKMKCIKCGLCVKICSEVINKGLLGKQERGFYTAIGTFYKEELPQSCTECGACIEECPVGALDWKKK